MGQTSSAPLSQDVRNRVKSFKVDEILSSERLLKQATTNSTTAFSEFRLTVVKTRSSEEADEAEEPHSFLSTIRFWHLGQIVDCSAATVDYDEEDAAEENIFTEEGSWKCECGSSLQIRFEQPVAVSEFAFRTHPQAMECQDLLQFKIQGTKNREEFITLFDSAGVDFATPTRRGQWAPRVELGDKAVSVETAGAKHKEKFAEMTEKYAGAALQGWLSGTPTSMPPCAQTRALMECCKAQVVGESMRRREALFDMLYSTSEAAVTEAEQAAAAQRLRARAVATAGGGGSGIASLTASCATRVILESGLHGPQAEVMLNMLNDQIAAGVAGIDLPPANGELPAPLASALDTASAVCRDQLKASLTPMSGIRDTLGHAFRNSDLKGSEKVEFNLLRGLLVKAGDLSEVESSKLIETAKESLGIRPEEKFVNYHDFLDWLCVDNGRASKRLSGLTKAKYQSPKVAEFMLRLAGLRGSLGDALVVANWVMKANPDMDMSGLWKGAENLFSLLSAWSREYYDEDKDWTNHKTVNAAIRSYAPASGHAIRHIGPEGSYAEVRLEAGASKSRIGFVPVGDAWKESGVGLQNGLAWTNGSTGPLEEGSLQRGLMDGDVVGLHMIRGKGVEIYINGLGVGRLPWLADLEVKGCHLCVCELHSMAEVVINIGQAPFEFPVAGAVSWCKTTGCETFEEARAQAVKDAGGSAGPAALGTLIMRTLARNCATVPAGKQQVASTKKIFESAHPYLNNTHAKTKVEIPNAKSYKITWDPRTRMENECDYVSFFLDEELTKQVGKAKYTAAGGPGSTTCPELTVEAGKFWFLFHTDGSQVDWGWKLTVEAELKAVSNNIPLKVQADEPTIVTMCDMLESPGKVPSAAVEALLLMIPRHVNCFGGSLGNAGEEVSKCLLGLAREKGEVAVKGAAAFGDCCAALLGSPEGLLRAQLDLWGTMDKYNPDALGIVSSNIASADIPFGSLVDNPDTADIVKQLMSIIVKDPTNQRVPKLLWRVFSDGVAYLVAGRSKKPADAWSVVLQNVRQVFELGASIKDSDLSGSSPPPFMQVLVMPCLHGLALIPSLSAANWDDVVGLLPCVGALFSKGSVYPPLKTATLALITTLGSNLVNLGATGLSDPAAKDALKVLQSPLLKAIPTKALGPVYEGAPIGVQMVEKAIGTKLSVADAGTQANPVLQEMMDASTRRASELVSLLEAVEPNPQKAFFPPNMHTLIFCLLASRFHAVETLGVALSDVEAGKGLTQQPITQIWGQARRLGFPWLINVKQRLTAAGRTAEQTIKTMEESLRILVSCEPPEDVTDPGEDDGLSAMWEQQGRLGGVDFADTQPLSPKWGSVPQQLKDLKRIGLLMKPIPTGVNHLPAQQIREFFDSQWIEKENPVEFLLSGIRANSVAMWRRAAGISLLAWALNTCAEGAEPWVSALAVNTLGKAWEAEASLPQSSAEVPAVTALAVARRYALESTVRFLVAVGDGRTEGPALQVMSLSALAGPWHPWDQTIVVAANVFGAVHPHLPWVGEASPTDKKSLRQLRGHAARLAVESLTGLVSQGEAGTTPPLLAGMLGELYNDLSAMQVASKKEDGDDDEGLSLKALFGADAMAKAESKKKETDQEPNMSADSIIEDIRRRLQAGEDFGDFPEESWEDFLGIARDVLRDWGGDSGRRPISELVEGEEDSESEGEGGSIPWHSLDVDGDGYIDRFEVLRAIRRMMGAEGNEMPNSWPPGLPRYAGDTGETQNSEEEADAGPPCFLQTLVVPKAAGVPSTALLMSLDSVLRLCATMGTGGDVECPNECCEKLINLTSGGTQESLFSLSILRHRPSVVSEAMVPKACQVLMDAICMKEDPGWLRGVDATIAHQRAAVVREWLVNGGATAQSAKDALMAALASGGSKVKGSMYVLGSAPLCHALCSARVMEGNHACTVVDATATGPVWQFHPHMDSPGNDIEHVGALGVEALKEKCLEMKGVCFNTDGWIKRVLLDQLTYWVDDPARGLYVLKHKNAPVAILRADGTGMSEAAAGRLVVLGAEANLSPFGPDALKEIVSATSQIGMEESAGYNHLNWALRAALRQSGDAVEHFVDAGGLTSWMGTVFQQAWPLLGDMSVDQRSSVASSIRLEFPKQFKRSTKGVFHPPEEKKPKKKKGEDDEDVEGEKEAEEAAKKALGVVSLAIGVLGMSPLPAAEEDKEPEMPDVEDLIPVVRSVLSEAPTSRVLRVVGLMPDEPPPAAEDRMGMVDGAPKASALNKDCPVTALMETVRKDTDQLEGVAKQAAAWEHHALAVDVCLYSVLQLSKRPGGAEKLAQVPANQMARLCLEFGNTLASEALRAEARSAMLTLARQNEPLVVATLELAMAHLVGSLGVLPGASGKTKSATQFESEHPYQNYTDKREEVVYPGAKRIVITFDQQSTTEENCDYIDFTGPTIEGTIRKTGGPDGRWTEIVVQGDRFTYHWRTDHSCTRWGWIFTCKPEGIPAGGKSTDVPKLESALYLTEFVLDLVPAIQPSMVLRPELAAVLLGLTEMSFNVKLVDHLQRFISLCSTHSVVLDWAGAAQTLQSLIQKSQAANQKEALAAAITMRMALPEVKVPQSPPRFKQAQGVYLSEQDQVCISRSNRKSMCYVATKATALCFKRLTKKETWVGLAKGTEGSDRIMIRLTDGATCTGDAVTIPETPVDAAQLEDVRVQYNASTSTVSFDGSNGFQVSVAMPESIVGGDETRSVVAEGRGGWRFAVRLCELSSGSRVSLPVGMSNEELTKLTTASEAIKAVSTYKPASEWPQDFVVPAFLEWYDIARGLREPPDGLDTTEFDACVAKEEDEECEESEWPPKEVPVWGAGIEKFNGTYKIYKKHVDPDEEDPKTEQSRNAAMHWKNENGCYIRCAMATAVRGDDEEEDEDDPPHYAVFSEELDSPPVYMSTFKSDYDEDLLAFTVDPAGGSAPSMGSIQLLTEKVLEDTNATSSEEERAGPDFEVLKVVATSQLMVFYKVHGEVTGQRPRLYIHEGGERRCLPSRFSGHISTGHGLLAVDISSESDYSKITFAGGEACYSEVMVYRQSKTTPAALLERLARRHAVPIESTHPLPAGERKVMKLSAEGGQGIMIQFSAKSQLPGKMIAAVTADEAGLRPLRLKRNKNSTIMLSSSALKRMNDDAARGIISEVKSQSYKVQASECYLHYPLPRPVNWNLVGESTTITEASPHPYESNSDVKREVRIPGAQRLRVQFHAESVTEGGYDHLRFYTDEACEDSVRSFEGHDFEEFEIPGDHFWYTFTSDGGTELWGYEFTVSDASLEASLPPGGMLIAVENGSVIIRAGWKVKRAWYGMRDKEYWWSTDANQGALVTDKVRTLQSKSQGGCDAEIPATNDSFGDPSPGNQKALLIELEASGDQDGQVFTQGVHLADDGSMLFEGNPAPTSSWTSVRSSCINKDLMEQVEGATEEEMRSKVEGDDNYAGYFMYQGDGYLLKANLCPAKGSADDGGEYDSEEETERPTLHIHHGVVNDCDVWHEIMHLEKNPCEPDDHSENMTPAEAKAKCINEGYEWFSWSSDQGMLEEMPAMLERVYFFKTWSYLHVMPRAAGDLVTFGVCRYVVGERNSAPFIVRTSTEALSWLPSSARAGFGGESEKASAEARCKVLAGEVSIDFANAPIEQANLAVGVAVKPRRMLKWPKTTASSASQATTHDAPPLATEEEQALVPRTPRSEVPSEAAEANESSSQEMGLEWWWRCDGESHFEGGGTKVEPAPWSFGAGDVIGVVALLEGVMLRGLRLTRAGHTISSVTFPEGKELPAVEEGKDHCLELCVGVRRSPACISLSPIPQNVLPVVITASGAEPPLTELEQQSATVVFHALDASKDGSLDRTEIANALGGAREELFKALDSSEDGKVSLAEWTLYCSKVKGANGIPGLGLFLDAFRKKLAHSGVDVTFPDAPPPKEAWGLHVTVTPTDLRTASMLSIIQRTVPEYYSQFVNLAGESWAQSTDIEILNHLQSRADRHEEGDIKSYMASIANYIVESDETRQRKKDVPTVASTARFLARLFVIKCVNSWIEEKLLPFTDLPNLAKHSYSKPIGTARHFLYKSTKYGRFDQIVQATFTDEEANMCFKRQLKIDCEHAEECDIDGTKMLFAQASQQAEGYSNSLFRSRAPNYNRIIRVSYEGEDGVDQGGLYRDFLDAMSTELMSNYLPLFVPTPNGRDNKGECREAWTLAPGKPTQAGVRMLTFLGRMMSICVRRGDVIPLSLSAFTWKLLIGDTPTLVDLEKADVNTAQSIRQLMDVEAMGVTEDDFSMVFGDMFFVYPNSANEMVPLCEGGATKPVTFSNAPEFARAVLDMRINEAAESIAVIRAGLAGAVPIGCFALWQYQDLEFRVCGNPNIDLAQLRNHVRYDGYSETDDQIKYLWEALEQFEQQDLQFFIRFCWGRSRLPPEGSTQWGDGFKVSRGSDIPPTGLPRAHTCFFQIDLPAYTSTEQTKERLLYAARNCVSMLNS